MVRGLSQLRPGHRMAETRTDIRLAEPATLSPPGSTRRTTRMAARPSKVPAAESAAPLLLTVSASIRGSQRFRFYVLFPTLGAIVSRQEFGACGAEFEKKEHARTRNNCGWQKGPPPLRGTGLS